MAIIGNRHPAKLRLPSTKGAFRHRVLAALVSAFRDIRRGLEAVAARASPCSVKMPMNCSTVYLVRFMVRPLLGQPLNSKRRKNPVAGHRIVAEEMPSIKNKTKHEKASYYKTHGLRKSATIEPYLVECGDEMVKAVTGHSGVEILKKYGGPIHQRELAKRAQEERNQMERNKTET
jgi:hypothetical protein